jgi:hypothetical protein
LGDFQAINAAYPHFRYQNYMNRSKFREPDACNAYHELKKILPEFQKVDGAKKIAIEIDPNRNKSESFKQTIAGMYKMFNELKSQP